MHHRSAGRLSEPLVCRSHGVSRRPKANSSGSETRSTAHRLFVGGLSFAFVGGPEGPIKIAAIMQRIRAPLYLLIRTRTGLRFMIAYSQFLVSTTSTHDQTHPSQHRRVPHFSSARRRRYRRQARVSQRRCAECVLAAGACVRIAGLIDAAKEPVSPNRASISIGCA